MDSSLSWGFFASCLISPWSFGPCPPVADEFDLTRQLASILYVLPGLLEGRRCVTEVIALYRTLRSVVKELKIRHMRSRDARCATIDTWSARNLEASEQTRAFLQDLRSYGLSLTLAATMNTIIRLYEPDKVRLVVDLASIVQEIIAVACEASQFEPIGSGFVSPFLDTVWAVHASSRPSILAVSSSCQLGFTVGRANIFATKLQRVLSTLETSLNPTSGDRDYVCQQ